MRGGRAILAVPRVIDDDYPAAVRRGRVLRPQHLQPTVVDLLGVTGRLRQEELQPLHRRATNADYRFRTGHASQRLVAVLRHQWTGQVFPESAPFRDVDEEIIKASRILRPQAQTDTAVARP